jgi:hypothetical protein
MRPHLKYSKNLSMDSLIPDKAGYLSMRISNHWFRFLQACENTCAKKVINVQKLVI